MAAGIPETTASPYFTSLVEKAKRSKSLHLNGMHLTSIPAAVFALTDLVRLDLGHNEIEHVPAEIGNLVKLEELWVNDNPLRTLPTELELCTSLRALDAHNTLLTRLPKEMSRLKWLVDVDVRNTPLKPRLGHAFTKGSDNLVQVLAHRDQRRILKSQLTKRLVREVYREQADSEEGKELIGYLVKNVFYEFTDFGELRSLIRNAERLFHPDLEMASAPDIRDTFVKLKRENTMKKLAAEVELKLRAIYFNKIKPETVEGVVKAIYGVITRLEDIKFLLFYATRLFPPEPEDMDANKLLADLQALRKQLREEREAAVNAVNAALRGMYTDQEPEKVRELADGTAKFFKRVEDLKQLAADANDYFPTEFTQAVPKAVYKRFLEVQEEKAAEDDI